MSFSEKFVHHLTAAFFFHPVSLRFSPGTIAVIPEPATAGPVTAGFRRFLMFFPKVEPEPLFLFAPLFPYTCAITYQGTRELPAWWLNCADYCMNRACRLRPPITSCCFWSFSHSLSRDFRTKKRWAISVVCWETSTSLPFSPLFFIASGSPAVQSGLVRSICKTSYRLGVFPTHYFTDGPQRADVPVFFSRVFTRHWNANALFDDRSLCCA